MALTDDERAGEGEEDEPLSFRARTARVLALVAIFVVMGIWGWALFFPPSTTPPGTLTDRRWPQEAEQVCTNAAARLAELPKSFETTTAIARSEVIVQTNVILNEMLDQLAALPPSSDPGDVSDTTEWLADWRTYVGDRATYAASLARDPNTRFYVSLKENKQVTVPVDFFAKMNKMFNCVTPDDIE